ncbi:hypothetical protein BDZ97DRAFT_1853509 [Flammula alnicola]|nr:hypothetical protein BDZ97DRAFT_1853509 [Flammula alnicola]
MSPSPLQPPTTDLLGFLDNFADIGWDFNGAGNDTYVTEQPIYEHVPPTLGFDERGVSRARSTTSESSSATTPTFTASADPPARAAASRSKPLLSTPQKRLNHILSEQKRRNAIRDGYAQLIALMAPAGSAPGIAMPTRGRPKGSGSRGKGQSKGKSGVLFRAVEYCRWLEEGRNSLREEVIRVETAAGIRQAPSS